MEANRDRDEEIFSSLVKGHGCGLIVSVIAASGDALKMGGDMAKSTGFVGLRVAGMSAVIDDGGDELNTIVDMDNLWTVAFAASKPQLAGIIDALQSAVDFLGDMEEVRAVDDIADILPFGGTGGTGESDPEAEAG